MSCYIVQEIDGTSRFTLEDGSGFLLLEDCIPTPPGGELPPGGPYIRGRRKWRTDFGEEDDIVAVILSEL